MPILPRARLAGRSTACSKLAATVGAIDDAGEIVTRCSLRIDRSLDRQPERGIGILGQPEPRWYFPRALTELLRSFFDAGWNMDGVQEPAFPPDLATPTEPSSWRNLAAIPPVFVVRLRPVTKETNRPRDDRYGTRAAARDVPFGAVGHSVQGVVLALVLCAVPSCRTPSMRPWRLRWRRHFGRPANRRGGRLAALKPTECA